MTGETSTAHDGDQDQHRVTRPRTYAKKLNNQQNVKVNGSDSKEFDEPSTNPTNISTHKENTRDIMSFLLSTQALINDSKTISSDSESDHTQEPLETPSCEKENIETSLNDEELLNKIRSLRPNNSFTTVSEPQNKISNEEPSSQILDMDEESIEQNSPMEKSDAALNEDNFEKENSSGNEDNASSLASTKKQTIDPDVSIEQNSSVTRESISINVENKETTPIESVSDSILPADDILDMGSDDENFLKHVKKPSKKETEETYRITARIKRDRNLGPAPTNKKVALDGFLKLFKKKKPHAISEKTSETQLKNTSEKRGSSEKTSASVDLAISSSKKTEEFASTDSSESIKNNQSKISSECSMQDITLEFEVPKPLGQSLFSKSKNSLNTKVSSPPLLPVKPLSSKTSSSLPNRLAKFGIKSKLQSASIAKLANDNALSKSILLHQRAQIRKERENKMEQMKLIMKDPTTSQEKKLRKEVDDELEREILIQKAKKSAMLIRKREKELEEENQSKTSPLEDESEEEHEIDHIISSGEEQDESNSELEEDYTNTEETQVSIDEDEDEDADEDADEDDQLNKKEGTYSEDEDKDDGEDEKIIIPKNRKHRPVLLEDDADEQEAKKDASTQVIMSNSLHFDAVTGTPTQEIPQSTSANPPLPDLITNSHTQVIFSTETQQNTMKINDTQPVSTYLDVSKISSEIENGKDHSIDDSHTNYPGFTHSQSNKVILPFGKSEKVTFLDDVNDFPDPTPVSQIPPATPLSPPPKLKSTAILDNSKNSDMDEGHSNEHKANGAVIPHSFLRRLRQKHIVDDDDLIDVEGPTQITDVPTSKSLNHARKRSEKSSLFANEILDEEALESEDEWAGLGGASDDDEKMENEEEEEAELKRVLINDNDETILKGDTEMEAKNLALLAKKLRATDEEMTKELLEMTTGEWRKKGGRNGGLFDDFSDDDYDEFLDDDNQRLLRLKHKMERQESIKLEIMANKDLSYLVSDPKASAFLRQLMEIGPDTRLDSETKAIFGDDDVEKSFGDELPKAEDNFSEIENNIDNDDGPLLPKKRSNHEFETEEQDQWAIMKRRVKEQNKKRRKLNLDDVHSQLSFLDNSRDENDAQTNDENPQLEEHMETDSNQTQELTKNFNFSLKTTEDIDENDDVSFGLSDFNDDATDSPEITRILTLAGSSATPKKPGLSKSLKRKSSYRHSEIRSEGLLFGQFATRNNTISKLRSTKLESSVTCSKILLNDEGDTLEESSNNSASIQRQEVTVTVGLPIEASKSSMTASINYQKKGSVTKLTNPALSTRSLSARNKSSSNVMIKNGSKMKRVDPSKLAAAKIDKTILKRLKSSKLPSLNGTWS